MVHVATIRWGTQRKPRIIDVADRRTCQPIYTGNSIFHRNITGRKTLVAAKKKLVGEVPTLAKQVSDMLKDHAVCGYHLSSRGLVRSNAPTTPHRSLLMVGPHAAVSDQCS